VTGCSASPASSTGAAGAGQPSSPAVADSGPAGQSAAPAPSASASPADSAGIQDLLVSSAVRSQLTAAYLALLQIPAWDVSGTTPDSVYYAYDQAANTYWAMATFVASKTASMNVAVDIQDGKSTGLFSRIGSGPWQVQVGSGTLCVVNQYFPKAVLTAWAVQTNLAGVTCWHPPPLQCAGCGHRRVKRPGLGSQRAGPGLTLGTSRRK
jgi:hypothetical protein